jgi:hypothetical protein
MGVCEPFSIPLMTSYLEVFGDDADGALLLAVFPLPEPEALEDDGPLHLSVTIEGGQTVAIQIALCGSPKRHEFIIQMTYADAAATTQGAEPAVPGTAPVAFCRPED